jgi:glycosyltransferase involved in cell wall biosynthesis
VLRHLPGFDLVIMTQEAKLLPNYFLHTWRYLGGPRIAYWGHGRNFQPRPGAWAPEGVKRLSARLVDWWFAYTDLTARVLMDFAVPRDRITVVNNSIDTSALRRWREQVGAAELEAFRRSLGIQSDQVAIFSGGMHADKRIDFLLDACLAIRRQIPDFEMIFVGDGPEAGLVRNAAAQHRWIHFLGPLFDADRVLPFAAAKVTLMPGLVGLVILDAFVFEAPLVTVTAPYHSPEIAYLKNEENGLMVDAGSDPDKYAEAVAGLMADARRLGRLQDGCRQAARRYSVEDMGLRFAEGVVSALERYPRDKGGG